MGFDTIIGQKIAFEDLNLAAVQSTIRWESLQVAWGECCLAWISFNFVQKERYARLSHYTITSTTTTTATSTLEAYYYYYYYDYDYYYYYYYHTITQSLLLRLLRLLLL